jgi:hypothetical protein
MSFEEARGNSLIPKAIPALKQNPPYSNTAWLYLNLILSARRQFRIAFSREPRSSFLVFALLLLL